MALNLSDENRAVFQQALERAEPYPEGAPELDYFDGDVSGDHILRVAATIAKRRLDQDDREKAAEKQQG